MKKIFTSFAFLVLFGGYAALQYLNLTGSSASYAGPVAVTNTSAPTPQTTTTSGASSQSAPPPSENEGNGGTEDGGSVGQQLAQTTPPPAPVTTPKSQGQYTDGTYTGATENAYYGDVKVRATVSGGKLAGVQFLQYPNTHSTSIFINQQAMPILTQEAIQAQSANVNGVSGATFTSEAFVQSLSSALAQAKA